MPEGVKRVGYLVRVKRIGYLVPLRLLEAWKRASKGQAKAEVARKRN